MTTWQDIGTEGRPDDVVGHKTFDTGDRFWKAAEAAKADRAERMPDVKAALDAMHDAYTRLRELGWREASYCPKDGTHFQAIEAGSTGIHDANYTGEWPNGSWWIYDGDVWPSRPILFRLYPEDQKKEEARWAAGRERLKAMMASGELSPSPPSKEGE